MKEAIIRSIRAIEKGIRTSVAADNIASIGKYHTLKIS